MQRNYDCMASSPPDTYMVCGGPAMPRFRRVVKEEVNVLWTRIKKKELEGGSSLIFQLSKIFLCARHVIVHTLI